MFLSHQHAPTHPPIFLPFELLSTFLSMLPLLLCVCQGTRAVGWQNKASRQKHHIQLPKSSPRECWETIRQLREASQNSGVPQTSASRLVLKDKPETVYFKSSRHANKKTTCPLHWHKATTTCRVSINIILLQRSFQQLQILDKSISEFLNSFTNLC